MRCWRGEVDDGDRALHPGNLHRCVMDPTAPKFRQGKEPDYMPDIAEMNARAWCWRRSRFCERVCNWCAVHMRDGGTDA